MPVLEKFEFRVLNSSKAPPASKTDTTIDLLDQHRLYNSLGEHNPDYVIHLAGITNTTQSDPRAYYETNVIGTPNLLKSIDDLKKAPRHIILASSTNIYGNKSDEIITENTALEPVNHYAASKLTMELMAKQWHNQLLITIVRPFNYTGVGQSKNFLIPKIVSHYKEAAQSINLGNLNVSCDFNDVRFVVNAYLRLLDNVAAIGKTINICSGRSYSIKQTLDICEKYTNHSLNVNIDPSLVRVNEVKKLMGTPYLLNFYAPNLPQISLEDTLRWMLKGSLDNWSDKK